LKEKFDRAAGVLFHHTYIAAQGRLSAAIHLVVYTNPRTRVAPYGAALMAQKKKLTLYLPDNILQELQEEAERQDRSISWLLQTAWMISREPLRAMPGVQDVAPILPTSPNRLPRQ
jgi:uncharacterized small protein (TIGR04563 family)